MNFYFRIVAIVKVFMKIFMPTVISGSENIPGDKALIVCANHQHALDPFYVAYSVDRQIHFMGKKELFDIKILGWFLRKMGAFPVDRDKADITAVKTALKYLKSAQVLGIFPQGTRAKAEEMMVAKNGVAMFAAKTKCAVLPVNITYKKNKPRIFCKTYVTIGKVMEYEQLGFFTGDKEEYEAVSDRICEAIVSLSCK